MGSHDELMDALRPVVAAFDAMGVAYYVGGSVASGAFGEFRATNDVDIVADLQHEQAERFVATLGAAFFADLESTMRAITRHASFNVIHFETMLKVDVFVLRERPYDREAMRRRVVKRTSTSRDSPSLFMASPEDIVLAKLEWYREGGSVSERQWRDVQGVLRVQSVTLDVAYLRRWADELGLTDLLDRALAEAAHD